LLKTAGGRGKITKERKRQKKVQTKHLLTKKTRREKRSKNKKN